MTTRHPYLCNSFILEYVLVLVPEIIKDMRPFSPYLHKNQVIHDQINEMHLHMGK